MQYIKIPLENLSTLSLLAFSSQHVIMEPFSYKLELEYHKQLCTKVKNDFCVQNGVFVADSVVHFGTSDITTPFFLVHTIFQLLLKLCCYEGSEITSCLLRNPSFCRLEVQGDVETARVKFEKVLRIKEDRRARTALAKLERKKRSPSVEICELFISSTFGTVVLLLFLIC